MRVLGLGTILVDQQVLLSRFPDVDTKNEMSGHRTQVGGPVPTALAQLARLDHRCEFIGRWGRDAFGGLIEQDLRAAALGHQWAQVVDDGATGFAHVWIDQSNGNRTVAFTRGSCGTIEAVNASRCDASEFELLHLDGWSADAAYALASRIKASDGLVTMDSGSPKPGMERLFPLVDLLNCPARFARQFFGYDDCDRAAEALLSQGAKRVVFTHGADGAVFYDGQQRLQQPAFPIAPVDTNGAGDVFCGGLIYGLLKQMSPQDMLAFAAAAAAIKCQGLGNREALATLDAIQSLSNIGR